MHACMQLHQIQIRLLCLQGRKICHTVVTRWGSVFLLKWEMYCIVIACFSLTGPQSASQLIPCTSPLTGNAVVESARPVRLDQLDTQCLAENISSQKSLGLNFGSLLLLVDSFISLATCTSSSTNLPPFLSSSSIYLSIRLFLWPLSLKTVHSIISALFVFLLFLPLLPVSGLPTQSILGRSPVCR